jgi:hypothetical protein
MDARKTLLLIFCIPLFVSLVVVVLYESDLLLPGQWTGDTTLEYGVSTAMELLAICVIPVALRLFQIKSVRARLTVQPVKGLITWGSLRLCLLTVPMMVNTWLYYMFMNVAFGYMAIILLLSLMFVYPSKVRCEQDVK